MTAPQEVRPGTAEQLARIAHFRALEDVQPEELDYVALFLLGDVGDSAAKYALWQRIRPVCEHLWSFVTDDWDEDDCDAMSEQEVELPAGHGWNACAERTRERLVREIESEVRLALYRAAEADRPGHPFAAVFAGTVDMRRPKTDGGPSTSEFLRSKGERA